MNEMIDGFLKAAKDTSNDLNVKNLMTKDEQKQWETLVKAMDSIDIMHIGRDLEKINETYQLDKWQELSLLAYIKVLELMMVRIKDVDGMTEPSVPEPKHDTYTGSMFG
tara:strand:+ start:375 stop:701 length:327 start_codon:yes stop_codon:yes gene_type:complete